MVEMMVNKLWLDASRLANGSRIVTETTVKLFES